jgi:long-chain acyl-CoA synthetase
MSMETLPGLLARVTKEHGPKPVLSHTPRYRTEVWTYDRLLAESELFAIRLQNHGIVKGDRLVLWAPNSPWWVAAFFGALRLGAVVVPLDIRSSPDFVSQVVAQSGPRLVLLSRFTRASWTLDLPSLELEEMAELATEGSLSESEIDADDIAEIIFTSGTTGDPKGVILTHGNITSNAKGASQVIPPVEKFRLLSVLPLSHMFEQCLGLILALTRGASIHYPPSRQSTILFRCFQEQKITTVLAVPQALQLFMDAIEREARTKGKEQSFKRLQAIARRLPIDQRRKVFRKLHQRLGGEFLFFVSGGAPIDPDLVRRWETVGIRVIQGYGATETSPVMTATTWENTDPATVGRPIPEMDIRIADDGEVLARGPSVTRGYWQHQDATQAAFQDGWYLTGDLGELREGNLYLRGRKKNMIVLSNGQNVFPEDVELALHRTGKVLDAVVIGLPTPDGSQVHAVLLPNGSEAEPIDIIRDANTTLSAHQQIHSHTVWEEQDFPRTHTLKVKRQEVADAVAAKGAGRQKASSPSASMPPSEGTPLQHVIAEAARVGVNEIRPEARLGEDLGLDSLGRVELLAAIESELGVYLEESKVEPTTTVAEVEALIGAQERGSRPSYHDWPLNPVTGVARRALQVPAFALLDAFAPATVIGLDCLRDLTLPALFVSNHVSNADAPALIHALPPRVRGRLAVAAADDYFYQHSWIGAGVSLVLNAFPFSRTTNIRPTLERSARLLDEGWSILIFPEGTRTDTGELGAFKGGVGLLSVEMGVPVVPAYLAGIENVLPKHGYVPHRAKVEIRFGRPLHFAIGTPYDDATAAVEDAVRGLST